MEHIRQPLLAALDVEKTLRMRADRFSYMCDIEFRTFKPWRIEVDWSIEDGNVLSSAGCDEYVVRRSDLCARRAIERLANRASKDRWGMHAARGNAAQRAAQDVLICKIPLLDEGKNLDDPPADESRFILWGKHFVSFRKHCNG